MNIGDRVRLLYHKQEGIITKFLRDNMVEVEIEEGFRIPVLKSELVVIAKEEDLVFGAKANQRPQGIGTATAIAEIKVWAEVGVYLAFMPFNDNQLSVYLINNTDLQVLFTFGESNNGSFNGLAAGVMPKRSSQKVNEISLQNFEKWLPMLVQILSFKQGYGTFKESICKKLKFNSTENFFKSKKKAPILEQDAFLFQLDQQETESIVAIQAEVLKEAMLQNRSNETPTKIVINAKPKTDVDLHIEKLTNQSLNMTSGQILQLQLETFDKYLDNAIISNYDKITFIHGVGNGVLRSEIHKKLSKHPHVEYYQDAQKERFGYGATTVKFK
jgi:hypothetical protein